MKRTAILICIILLVLIVFMKKMEVEKLIGIDFFKSTTLLVTDKRVKDVDNITYELMDFIDNLLNSLDVRYFVSDGTLLGTIRNNKRIRHDNDIDLRIHPDDWYKFQDYINQLPTTDIPDTTYHYDISKDSLNKYGFSWIQFHTKNLKSKYNFIHADLVNADFSFKKIWYDQSYAFDKPLRRDKFGPINVWIPSEKNTVKMLTRSYGKNYIHPLKPKIMQIFNKDKLTNIESNIKISAIILSYNRPHNLNKSIPKLIEIDNIDEIIILHGHKDYVNYIYHPKVRNIDDWEENEKYYTFKRFKNAYLANNECILFLDDDVFPTKKIIKQFN